MSNPVTLPPKEWAWPIVLVAGLLALAWQVAPDHAAGEAMLPPVATLAWIAVLFFWMVHCFTGNAYEKRCMALVFSFFFMMLAFGMVGVAVMDVGNVKKFGVVEGCVESFDPNARSPIQCEYPFPPDGVERSAQHLVEAASVPPEPQVRGGAATPTPVRGRAKEARRHDAGASASTASTLSTPAIASSIAAAASGSSRLTEPEKLLARYRDKANYQYLVNIGGHLTLLENPSTAAPSASAAACATSNAVYAIRGGLPVPLYFVLFALMGGAISLSKNLPGIQKRSDDAWVGTPQESKLSAGATRELLLFQILQFISAPILAILAFHTIKPESMATAVMLAFSAGFASDVVLDQMRKLSNGSGTSPPAVPPHMTSSIRGRVTHAGSPVPDAKVEILQSNIPPTTTAADGSYTLVAVPVSPHPLAVQASATGLTSVPQPVTVATQAQAVVDLAI